MNAFYSTPHCYSWDSVTGFWVPSRPLLPAGAPLPPADLTQEIATWVNGGRRVKATRSKVAPPPRIRHAGVRPSGGFSLPSGPGDRQRLHRRHPNRPCPAARQVRDPMSTAAAPSGRRRPANASSSGPPPRRRPADRCAGHPNPVAGQLRRRSSRQVARPTNAPANASARRACDEEMAILRGRPPAKVTGVDEHIPHPYGTYVLPARSSAPYGMLDLFRADVCGGSRHADSTRVCIVGGILVKKRGRAPCKPLTSAWTSCSARPSASRREPRSRMSCSPGDEFPHGGRGRWSCGSASSRKPPRHGRRAA